MGIEGKREREKEKKVGRGRRREGGREGGTGRPREGGKNQSTPTIRPTVITWRFGFSHSQKMILWEELHEPASQEEADDE